MGLSIKKNLNIIFLQSELIEEQEFLDELKKQQKKACSSELITIKSPLINSQLMYKIGEVLLEQEDFDDLVKFKKDWMFGIDKIISNHQLHKNEIDICGLLQVWPSTIARIGQDNRRTLYCSFYKEDCLNGLYFLQEYEGFSPSGDFVNDVTGVISNLENLFKKEGLHDESKKQEITKSVFYAIKKVWSLYWKANRGPLNTKCSDCYNYFRLLGYCSEDLRNFKFFFDKTEVFKTMKADKDNSIFIHISCCGYEVPILLEYSHYSDCVDVCLRE